MIFRQIWIGALGVLLLFFGCGGGSSVPGPPTVSPAPKIVISPFDLPRVVQGQAYNFSFQASGGTGSLTWSTPDALPTGMALSSNGALTGSPTVSGSFYFAVQVHDSGSPQQTAVANAPLYVIGILSLDSVSFPEPTAELGTTTHFGHPVVLGRSVSAPSQEPFHPG